MLISVGIMKQLLERHFKRLETVLKPTGKFSKRMENVSRTFLTLFQHILDNSRIDSEIPLHKTIFLSFVFLISRALSTVFDFHFHFSFLFIG